MPTNSSSASSSLRRGKEIPYILHCSEENIYHATSICFKIFCLNTRVLFQIFAAIE